MSVKCQNCGKTTNEMRICKKCGHSGCNSCYTNSCPKCNASSPYMEKRRF